MTSNSHLSYASPLWNRKFAQDVDRLSAEACDLNADILMEAAGRAVYEIALEFGARERPVLILAGPGNNGGDALVAARYLHEAGIRVQIFLVAKSGGKFSAMCQAQLQTVKALGMSATYYTRGIFAACSTNPPLVIDGVFGLGFRGELDPDHPAAQALAEAATLPDAEVLAVDLPSGLDIDMGSPQSLPLPADCTVTFGALKPAHILAPARDNCGHVLSVDIGFPWQAVSMALNDRSPPYWLVNEAVLLGDNRWNLLSPSAHKYDRGHVLVIGGSAGKTGAAVLAGLGALRCGAGWVTLALPEADLESSRILMPPELTFEALFNDTGIDAAKLRDFVSGRRVNSIVIGPGCMNSPLNTEAVAFLHEFTCGGGFLICDAGATTGIIPLFSGASWPADNLIWTPHPGEWRKLSAQPPPDPLTPDNLEAVRAIAEDLGVTLMHKGATPVIVPPEDIAPALVCNAGSRVLAKAGTGDVLAGAVAAHGAIGYPAAMAGARAYSLVSLAATQAATQLGYDAVIATDIINRLGTALMVDEEPDRRGT